MPRYNDLPVIVRASDLRARTVDSRVAKAVLDGTARLLGFKSERDARALLAARVPARSGASLASMKVRKVIYEEVDEYPWQPSRPGRRA